MPSIARTTSEAISFSDYVAIPTRNTHHRQHDHFARDLDTNVELDGAIGSIADGTTVHSALSTIHATAHGSTTINVIIDGGGSAITTGVKGDVELPFAGTISAARMFADQTGSIVVNLWKDTYANFPPTVADKITASAPPTISTADKSQDTTLTGWTTTFAAGDVLRVNVDSATTITRVTLSLTVARS